MQMAHSGSRHSLSKLLSQNKRRVTRGQRAAHHDPPGHGQAEHMEHSLLKLLDQFNSGKLRAFDSAYSLDQMESIRDQQVR